MPEMSTNGAGHSRRCLWSRSCTTERYIVTHSPSLLDGIWL